MDKLSFYHGTTLDNALNILKNGFDQESNRVWTVSEHNSVYAYGISECLEELKTQEFDPDDYTNPLELALESATASACVHNYLGTDLAVIEFEIDQNDLDELSEDYSNHGARLEQAFEIYPEMAYDSIVKIHVFKNIYRPDLRFFYMHSGMQKHSVLDEKDLEILNIIMQSEPCSIYEFISDELSHAESDILYDKNTQLVTSMSGNKGSYLLV